MSVGNKVIHTAYGAPGRVGVGSVNKFSPWADVVFGLLRVCRQMYLEVSPLACALNAFSFYFLLWDVRSVYHRLTQTQIDRVRVVKVTCPDSMTRMYHKYRQPFSQYFPNLRRVVVSGAAAESIIGRQIDSNAWSDIANCIQRLEGQDVEVVLEYSVDQ
ncbi:hypothetical protein EK21DRAFT_92361 [Setomelanomma holmii]|uniref:Uncharacterized protein n=1 Tax=Setomelanomma holmii TaxID=210430 RepID=A0A9P4H4I5_9PLEO|nr:hypothetical protein EK21DRAFT_92361 [Setomelanomma holmii]